MRTAVSSFQVMTFNIRYGTADDGANSWPHRRDLVVETITQFQPDILAIQEGLAFQVEFLTQQFPHFHFCGVGRDDGRRQGEFAGILFHKMRFELVEEGHFWLSETPHIPGSKSWDSDQPRVVTWCRIRDRQSALPPIFAANTHFDLRGAIARRQSARLLRQHLQQVTKETPLLVTGDFNSTEDAPEYHLLTSGESPRERKLIDAYRAIHPRRSEHEGTRHDFRGELSGPRIDWILHSIQLRTTAAEVIHTHREGQFPSDHFPVVAILSPAEDGESFDESPRPHGVSAPGFTEFPYGRPSQTHHYE